MNSRRVLVRSTLGLAVAGGFTTGFGPSLISTAQAQTATPGPSEGAHFRRLGTPLPTDDPKKIEVIEFFWFGCPHCNAIEPAVVGWKSKLPSGVAFRKEHVAFPQAIKHQQLFYTIKALGAEDKLTQPVFDAIHKERKTLTQVSDMAELAAKNGVDAKAFKDAYESFSVKSNMRRSASLAERFGVDGVPAFAVNGKYYTAPAMAGGTGQVLQVIDFLINRERSSKTA